MTSGGERQVALLRAVNLGSHRRVAMADLRTLLTRLGFTDVQTYLQSGNAVLMSTTPGAETAERIEAALEETFGVAIGVVVRSHDELAKVVDANPLGDVASDPSRHLVTFLSDRPDPDGVAGLADLDVTPEAFAVGEREVYLWCPNGVHKSVVAKVDWTRRLGVACATARNWNTVTKLLQLSAPA